MSRNYVVEEPSRSRNSNPVVEEPFRSRNSNSVVEPRVFSTTEDLLGHIPAVFAPPLAKPEDNDIYDVRELDAFKTSSFSGYKKTAVKLQLVECLKHAKVEEACYWSAELVASSHFIDLWDVAFLFLGKYIHLGNPVLSIYVKKKYALFRSVANDPVYRHQPLTLRNNPTIRHLFAELFSTMSLSEKKHAYEEIKVVDVQDIGQVMKHLSADSPDYTTGLLREKDPKEWTVSLNEFAYHISPQSRNMSKACFWLEWMCSYDTLCRHKKETLLCQKRNEYTELETKYRGDFIWLIWETLVQYAEKRGALETALIGTLFEFFRVRYSSGVIKKRKSLLYFAISILTETAGLKREILNETQKEMVAVAASNVHTVIYKELRKNAVLSLNPQDVEQQNMAKHEKNQRFHDSLQKLNLLNEHDFI